MSHTTAEGLRLTLMQKHRAWIRTQRHTATKLRAIPRLDSIAAQSCTGVIQKAAIFGKQTTTDSRAFDPRRSLLGGEVSVGDSL
jgi:hypothetical protein